MFGYSVPAQTQQVFRVIFFHDGCFDFYQLASIRDFLPDDRDLPVSIFFILIE